MTENEVPRWAQAEEFAAALFNELGYNVRREVFVGGLQVDMVVERHGLQHPVEVTISRSMRKITSDAARLLQVTNSEQSLSNPILLVVGSLTSQGRAWADSTFDVHVWDYQELITRTAGLHDLRTKLESLISADASSVSDPATPSVGRRRAKATDLINKLSSHEEENGLTPTQYEKLCREVFSFLFDPYLFGFSDQHRTTDGANRFDFVCRIKAGHQFWDAIQRDFRTRVVLFECKNYAEKITADQVYSTERYLFTSALRTVAFLVSRKGPDDGCFRAAQGAMRESGKLIILLSNKELMEMLELDEAEDGPASFLDQYIWKFVTGLPR